MKKFVVILVMLLSGIAANAQFTGGTETKEAPAKTIDTWGGFTKTLGLGNDGYVYSHISETPKQTPEGSIVCSILSLSLGTTKEECVQTLNAYKNLINVMEKGEWREITDSKSGNTYKVYKQSKNWITLVGTPIDKDKVLNHNSGSLTISDLDNMLKKL